MEPRYRRASATAEELEERRRTANGQGSTMTSTATQRKTTAREDRQGGVIGKSSLHHRPLNAAFVIPMTDGTEMHVTERELSTLPPAYKDAAVLVTLAPPKRQALPEPQLRQPQIDDLPKQRRRFPRFHWLVWVGLSMFMMMMSWIAFTALGHWWTTQTNDWRYGRPRTFQIDWNVGHETASNPMSHFIALNLNKHIEVIEFPGDDPSKSKIYIGPTLIGDGQELTPVTLSFEDVNNDGKPDLVIHIADSTFIFLNTGTGFKPAPNQ